MTNNPDKDAHKTVLEGLLSRRTVTLSGEINDESMSELAQRMITLQIKSDEPINLLIDSGGGGIFASVRICDLMTNLLTAPVRGIVIGPCASAATFVFLHCSERVCTPHARFMVHSGTMSRISVRMNNSSAEDLEQLLHEVKGLEETVTRLYMKSLTPTAWSGREVSAEERREFARKLIKRGDQSYDNWLSAEEAVEVGLVQRIETGKLPVFKS